MLGGNQGSLLYGDVSVMRLDDQRQILCGASEPGSNDHVRHSSRTVLFNKNAEPISLKFVLSERIIHQ